ncbi:MAG: UDP-2,4-diacetamido-2,4,6-trideoxy-beta-L-altropyranose hydrolase [Fimbriimonadaceae bacterium]|jgi:UDP-2,4-diacetamido-2,4,6-trideoxy-beta-L-altropyranose hydrolase|nr:UDP-2,4-diacetamido-2,4,6-trideoxy-beta-L-altropyranose hydrolase [Fimbriimonadaceae bacterium]
MRVLIRADASVAIGTGHVMRCLALAQALQHGGDEVTFAAAELPDALQDRLQGFEIKRLNGPRASLDDAAETAALAEAKDWVVLDGYAFNHAYQQALRKENQKLAIIDDGANLDGYSADGLINPNLYATEAMYEEKSISRLLVGHKYAMLRREFWERTDRPAKPRSRNVLITMGGSDPDNVTGKIIRSVKGSTLENIHIRAITGASNPYWETLQAQAARAGHSVELLRNVEDMKEQLEWADIAISAAGNTALELACVGVPSLFVVLVDNQEPVARAIRKFGFGRVLGWHEDVNEEAIRAGLRDLLSSSQERDRMSAWGRESVDGQGALRVAAALREP